MTRAKAVGLSSGALRNVLCGNKPGIDAKRRIEDFLGRPFWSSADEFAARQDTEAKRRHCLSAVQGMMASTWAASENFGTELQSILGPLHIDIVVVQFDGAPQSPFWKCTGTAEPFVRELEEAKSGAMFDSSMMLDGSYFCFYHTTNLGKTLRVLKSGLEALELLDRSRIFHVEKEAGWRMYWPATGELLEHE